VKAPLGDVEGSMMSGVEDQPSAATVVVAPAPLGLLKQRHIATNATAHGQVDAAAR
jgi:hypothetical protein